jgi:hypothetical protein
VTDAEYAILREAWDFERFEPLSHRRQLLLQLRARSEAADVVDALLVELLINSGEYEEAEKEAKRLTEEKETAWSLGAQSLAANQTQGPIAGLLFAERALGFDPNNAFALNAAWASATTAGNERLACRYSASLADFDPSEPRFVASYICDLIRIENLAKAREL